MPANYEANSLQLRVHPWKPSEAPGGPSLSYFERRGGDLEHPHRHHYRARELADATLPYGMLEGSFSKAIKQHPVTLSTMNTEHSETMIYDKQEHERKMEKLANEHAISMAQIAASAKTADPATKDAARLRELHLSALDGLHSQQNEETLARHKDLVTMRQMNAVGETQKQLVEGIVQAKRDNLTNLKAIERRHRHKMVQLDEEALKTHTDDTISAVEEDHNSSMASIQDEHAHKMEILKAEHASRMARLATPKPTYEDVVSASVPAEFGVATAHYLWSVGMPDEYVEQHNLARKLETALACIAAEKPDDPTARLAELLK